VPELRRGLLRVGVQLRLEHEQPPQHLRASSHATKFIVVSFPSPIAFRLRFRFGRLQDFRDSYGARSANPRELEHASRFGEFDRSFGVPRPQNGTRFCATRGVLHIEMQTEVGTHSALFSTVYELTAPLEPRNLLSDVLQTREQIGVSHR
jgi:hypothetical protein